ncbi:hypothetical protein BON30_45870 [Cystobacter ferrugineus]|uniref:Uncharacterized protein n=1 Tax=Cystobacter ferrugineus TaxID=83449 RepID=A0A1L9AVI9_9BACT|nr:hypothetical protein BON30_45870 [Cystobacter ferrugineus]
MKDFLEEYGRVVVRGDGKQVAERWEVPALVVADAGSRAVGSLEEVAAFFSSAGAQYISRGIVGTHPVLQRLEWVTERLAHVDVRWLYLDQTGAERGAEQSTYTLRRDDAGRLRILVALLRDVTPPTSN